MPGLPPLWSARRVLVCIWLIAIGIVQTLGAIALSNSAAALLSGANDVFGLPVATALIAAALIGLIAFVAQNRTAESFALSYIHDVRLSYTRQALLLPLDGKSPELGLSLTRLVNDLGAIKLWLSRGLLALITLAVSLVTLASWLVLKESSFLIPLAASLAVWATGISLVLPPLRASIRRARKKRGRLAILLGRALPERLPLLMHGKLTPVLERLSGKSRDVCKELVGRATWSGMIRALSRATFPCAVGTFALTGGVDTGNIALFLLIFAFVSLQFESGAAGLEFLEANRVAREKLQKVFELPAMAPVETLSGQSLDWREPIEITSLNLPSGDCLTTRIEAGTCTQIRLHDPKDLRHIALSLCGLSFGPALTQIRIGGISFAEINRKTLWRKIALISPENGFPSYQEKRPAFLFGARRDPGEAEQIALKSSLEIVEDRMPRDARTMPQSEQVRIRAARALLRKPRVLVVHDNSLIDDDALTTRLKDLARESGATLVLLSQEGRV